MSASPLFESIFSNGRPASAWSAPLDCVIIRTSLSCNHRRSSRHGPPRSTLGCTPKTKTKTKTKIKTKTPPITTCNHRRSSRHGPSASRSTSMSCSRRHIRDQLLAVERCYGTKSKGNLRAEVGGGQPAAWCCGWWCPATGGWWTGRPRCPSAAGKFTAGELRRRLWRHLHRFYLSAFKSQMSQM